MNKDEKCACPEKENRGSCRGCREQMPGYWCDVCNREVAEKRCPFCGLKARKIREEG